MPPCESSDPTPAELAALVDAAAHAPEPYARDEAIRRLKPFLEDLAGRVYSACRRKPASSEEAERFAGSALGSLWLKGTLAKYRPGQGPVEPYLRTVLRHMLVDESRAAASRREMSNQDLLVDEAEDGRDRFAALFESQTTLSSSDLACIEDWPPLDRVVLLVLVGIWVAVPADRWDDWVAQAGLETPYPPTELQAMDNKDERIRALANHLGFLANTLSQRLHRGKGRLLELEVFERFRRPAR
jgi:DNA-directed RNA polymerase specialized sigma24 family protein